jgi:hypothetical protein
LQKNNLNVQKDKIEEVKRKKHDWQRIQIVDSEKGRRDERIEEKNEVNEIKKIKI